VSTENNQDASPTGGGSDKPELETGLDTVGVDAPARAPTPAKAGNAPKDITQLKVEKSCSRGLAGWLGQHQQWLAITTNQSGRIYL
jgi:hypothetical protein